jgi:hypothetical protein
MSFSDITPTLGEISPTVPRTNRVDPVVADASPAIYAAANKVSLTQGEKNQIEQWSLLQKKHRELIAMDNNKAQAEFDKLAPEWQENLKAYFNTDYLNKPQTDVGFLRKAFFGEDGRIGISEAITSPFRALMYAGEEYYKFVNTPGSMAQLQIQGGGDLSKKTLERAFNGESMFNESMTNDLIAKHGGARSYVAMKLLNGSNPGEIIESWGPNDPNILTAVNEMFDENKRFEFEGMLEDFRQAQLSPGRTIANGFIKSLNIDPTKHKGLFNSISGSIDFAYQVFADPMTYLTMGGSAVLKGIGRSAKLGNELLNTGDIAAHFAKPDVAEFWNNYGKVLSERNTALKNKDLQTAAKKTDELKRFNAHNMDEDISLLTDLGVVDAATAQSAFERADMTNKLVRGRVDGLIFAREGAAYSKKTANFTTGAKTFVSNLFTGKRNYENIDDKDVAKVVDEITKIGLDKSGSALADMKNLEVAFDGNKVQKLISFLSSKHPLSRVVNTTEENVAKTLDVVRAQAFLLVRNKPMAEVITAHFLNLTPAERITFRKGIDTATLQRMGLDKVSGGREFMQKVLNDRYGVGGGLAVTDKVTLPSYLDNADGPVEVDVLGNLHAFQEKRALGALPWQQIQEFIAGKLPENASKAEIASRTIGTAYTNKYVRMATDVWSFFTLVPRLGIRTVMDEGFMYSMYLNTGLAKEVLASKRAGNILTAATASNRATGPAKALVQNLFSKATGKQVGALKSISIEARQAIHAANVAKYKDLDDAYEATKREIFDLAIARFGKRLPDGYKEDLWDVFNINPRALEDISASEGARATIGLTPKLKDDPFPFSEYAMDASYKAHDLSVRGTYDIVDFNRINNSQKTIIQFRNMAMRFTARPQEFGKKQAILDLPFLFISNNGLRTRGDFNLAVNEAMQRIGITDTGGGIYIFKTKGDQAKARKFLEASRQNTIIPDDAGIAEYVGVAKKYFETALSDLYTSFHGGHDVFNDDLFNAVRTATRKGEMRKFIRDLDIDTFDDLIKNNRVKGDVYTDIQIGVPSSNVEDWLTKYGDMAFEAMDRQINDIFRQPVTLQHYALFRKQYRVFEQQYAKKRASELVANGMKPDSAEKLANKEASRIYAEAAMNDAGNHVMKFSDNPGNRTIFAYNMRTVGRFYRAVEDFHRRMYRLVREYPLQTIYRLRLMSTGIESIGAVHQDADGHSYIVMPMDDVMFSAVDNTLRALTNNKLGINQPLFNDFTLKLSAGNPSFQDDAGMPYLSGPMGSLSVMGLKSIVGIIPGVNKFEESVDDMLLGTMGDNPTFSKLVPTPVRNLWSILNVDEKSQQEVTALQQAIAYNQANGVGIYPEDYTDENGVLDKAAFEAARVEYLDNLRISAHNVIVMRTMLNLVSPISTQMKETKDVPDYLKEVGEISLVQSFYEILNQMERLYPDASDHYELALATWTGQNPGKLAYLPSRTEKGAGVLLDYTKSMQNWMIDNKTAVEKYGPAVVAFAPHSGEFNSGVYNWARAAGFVANKDIDAYMKEVIGQENENAYWDLNDKEKQELYQTTDAAYRQSIINKYKELRNALELADPYLTEKISTINNEKKSEFAMSMFVAAQDTSINIPANVREDVATLQQLWEEFDAYCTSIDDQKLDDGANIKRRAKMDLIANVEEISRTDHTGIISNIYRTGLKGLINARSQSTRSVVYLGEK